MKVAWVCYYPAHLIPGRPQLLNDRTRHPVPWVSLQAPLVARTAGVQLHVITVGRHYPADDHFTHEGIRFHFLKVPRLPRVLLWYQVDRIKIQACLRGINPDLVHGFGTESGYSYAAVSSPYPSLVMMQGVQSEIVRAMGSRRWRQPHMVVPLLIEQFTVRKCRNFICETDFSARFVRRLNPTANIHTLRTPVRPEFFSRPRNPSAEKAPVLLFVGTLLPEKGIDVLLHSFAEVLNVFPGATLRVIGHSPFSFHKVLQSLMDRLNIADRVEMCGFLNIDQLVQHFAEATVLVLPSVMDTAPNVVAEAQVAGLPVVATAVGGIPEMIEDDISGVLVQPRSVELLTKGILRLLRDPVFRKSVAAAAQSRARAMCLPEIQVAKLVEVYRAVLSTS